MRRNFLSSFAVLSLFALTTALGGCGSSKKEGQNDILTTQSLASAARLGDENCLQCHNAGQDLTMVGSGDGRTIGEAWRTSLHHINVNGVLTVHCEDCHGGGQFHWGLGPLANPVPRASVCLTCHGNTPPAGVPAGFRNYTGYQGTAHANADHLPDRFFFQGGIGNDQATNQGVPEVVSGTGTPVTKSQHIEQCSVCHNNNQRFIYVSGNLQKPVFDNLSSPQVSCASCHDAHGIGKIASIATRPAGWKYPILRKVQVDANGANDPVFGNWTTPYIVQFNGAVQPDGTVDLTKVAGKNNELNTEVLCGACHTQGKYKYSREATHNENVYSQWKNSGHGERDAAPWAEFSANPQAYVNPNTGVNYTVDDLGHRTSYPFDMALNATGATATTTRNAGNNNFACFKCHNGIASLNWQDNVQGTPAASVVFGDEPAVCVTCHDPHRNVPNQSKNTRRPVVMTNYSTSAVKIVGNVFLDTKPLPSQSQTGNATICIFCHQGRESGFTLYKTKLAPGKSAAGAFFNPHYLGTAAMLWSANAYEYAGKSYGANSAHQGANCTTCHMANSTADTQNGGHTWNPNVATCNAASCHGGFGPIAAETGTANPDLDTYRAGFDTNDYDGDGILEPISVEIQHLQDNLIALFAANGIFYNDLKYPYFFADAASTTNFTAWNTVVGGLNAYKAAFNLQFIIKGLPSAATSQTLVPNASAAVHDHIYIIQLLHDSYDDYNAVAPVQLAPLALGGVRPVGTRPATVYGTGQ